jgi:hypothetical protein
MGLLKKDDGWRLPNEIWEQRKRSYSRASRIAEGRNPTVSDRAAMDTILFVVRTAANETP